MKETLLLGHGSGDEAICVTLDPNLGVACVFFGLPPPVTFMIIVSVAQRVKPRNTTRRPNAANRDATPEISIVEKQAPA
jgi:hypothetical protein